MVTDKTLAEQQLKYALQACKRIKETIELTKEHLRQHKVRLKNIEALIEDANLQLNLDLGDTNEKKIQNEAQSEPPVIQQNSRSNKKIKP